MLKGRKQLKALCVSMISAFLVIVSLYFLNHLDFVKKETQSKKASFDVVKAQKKKIPKKKIRPKPKKQSHAKKMKPILDLTMAAGGVDLGIDVLGLGMKDSQLLSGTGNEVLTEDVVDKAPIVTHREPMVYPEQALTDKVNGYVTINLLVDQRGRVEKIKIVDSQPVGLFDQSALQAVRNWIFQPAEFQGRTVAVWMKQKIEFKLN